MGLQVCPLRFPCVLGRVMSVCGFRLSTKLYVRIEATAGCGCACRMFLCLCDWCGLSSWWASVCLSATPACLQRIRIANKNKQRLRLSARVVCELWLSMGSAWLLVHLYVCIWWTKWMLLVHMHAFRLYWWTISCTVIHEKTLWHVIVILYTFKCVPCYRCLDARSMCIC